MIISDKNIFKQCQAGQLQNCSQKIFTVDFYFNIKVKPLSQSSFTTNQVNFQSHLLLSLGFILEIKTSTG